MDNLKLAGRDELIGLAASKSECPGRFWDRKEQDDGIPVQDFAALTPRGAVKAFGFMSRWSAGATAEPIASQCGLG